uniref:Reverse transcriptase Ty1/copia-type domain-containing protein n=1 Tax=Tanacetum cinerariifolium TaxID=118510 RepID=A0A6L2MQ76_TANCI|nr:hypothetical protein [Tanacetum cinerariifolium]
MDTASNYRSILDVKADALPYNIVKKTGIPPYIPVNKLLSVLQACATMENEALRKQIHCHVQKVSLDLIVYVSKALMDVYVKCGFIEVTYSSVLRGCASLTVLELGIQIHSLIIKTMKYSIISGPVMVTWHSNSTWAIRGLNPYNYHLSEIRLSIEESLSGGVMKEPLSDGLKGNERTFEWWTQRVDTMPATTDPINTTNTTNVSQSVVDENLSQLLDSRGGSHVTNVLAFDKEDFTSWKVSDSDVKKEQRTSNEFMADLNAEYHERALLANQKRFYKRYGRVGSARKPLEKTKETCFACGKLGHFQKDYPSHKTSTPSYPSSNSSLNKFKPYTPSFNQTSSQNPSNHQKDYKGKYKGLKAEIAVLTKRIDDMTKGKNDERSTKIRAFMKIAEDEPSVGKADARLGQWVDITMKKVHRLLYMTDGDERKHVLYYTHVDPHYVEDQRNNLVSKCNLLKQEISLHKSELSNLKNIESYNCSLQNEVIRVNLENKSLKDEIIDLKKLWVRKVEGKRKSPPKRNLFHLFPLIGAAPFGTLERVISLSDLTLNMADLTLDTLDPKKTRPSVKVSPTYVIKKKTEKSPTDPKMEPSTTKMMKLSLLLPEEEMSMSLIFHLSIKKAMPVSLPRPPQVSIGSDEYSRYNWVFCLKKKSDTAECILSFIKKMENLNEVRVNELRSDNRTEFRNHKMEEFCDEKAKAFRVFNIRRQEMEETIHVTFSEDDEAISQSSTEDPPKFTKADNHPALNEPNQIESPDLLEPAEPQTNVILKLISDVQPSPTISPTAEVILQTLVPQDIWSREKHIELVNIIGEPLAGITTRSRIRDLYAASAFKCLYVNFLSKMEPKKLDEALEEEGWIIAMQEELNQFKRNKMDIKSAFFNGKILEEVYVLQPPGFESNEYSNHVCKLDKAIYGLKQAPRAWYLKGTPNLGLWYPKGSGFNLKAYSDSDYAGCNLDRKSTSGGCQILGGKLVFLWIKSQLADYNVLYDKESIFCDNTSTIAISNNPVLYSRIKHIDIRYHFIRDHVLKGDIELYFVPTDLQLADIFTKPLAESSFTRLVAELAKLSEEPEQSLIPPSRESKETTDLKTKKKKIPPSSKPKSPDKVRVIFLKKQVAKTQHAEVTVATADATKSLEASELAEEQGNHPSTTEAVKVLNQHVEEEKDVEFVTIKEVDKEQSLEITIVEQLFDEADKLNKVVQEPPESPYDTKSEIKVVKSFFACHISGLKAQTMHDSKETVDIYEGSKSDLQLMPDDDLRSVSGFHTADSDEFNAFNKLESPRFVLLQKELSKSLHKNIKRSIKLKVRKGLKEVQDKLSCCTSTMATNSQHVRDLRVMFKDMVSILEAAEVFKRANAKGEKWEKNNPGEQTSAQVVLNEKAMVVHNVEEKKEGIVFMEYDSDFTNQLFGTTSSKFSPTPPREPTPPRDPAKGKELPFYAVNSNKEATMKIIKGDNPLNLIVHPNFRLKSMGFSECLEVMDQAKKLGLPSPPVLATFRMTPKEKKRKRTQFLKEAFVTEDIRNLRVVDSEVMKGLSEYKALESNIRRIRVKDIVKEVEDYLKTYSSVGMDISWRETQYHLKARQKVI